MQVTRFSTLLNYFNEVRVVVKTGWVAAAVAEPVQVGKRSVVYTDC